MLRSLLIPDRKARSTLCSTEGMHLTHSNLAHYHQGIIFFPSKWKEKVAETPFYTAPPILTHGDTILPTAPLSVVLERRVVRASEPETYAELR